MKNLICSEWAYCTRGCHHKQRHELIIQCSGDCDNVVCRCMNVNELSEREKLKLSLKDL